jgi:hypothetical protein
MLVDLGCFYAFVITAFVYEAPSIFSGDVQIPDSWWFIWLTPIIAVNGLTGIDRYGWVTIFPVCIIIAVLVIGVKLKQTFRAATFLWPLMICIATSVGCLMQYGKNMIKLLKF